MQSNKASKKTTQKTPEISVPVAAATTNDTASKPRASRSSKSKSESVESSAVKRHRKAAAPTAEEAIAAPAAPLAATTVVEEFAAIPAEVTIPARSEFSTGSEVSGSELSERWVEPSYEQIAMLAHALWLERGCEHGCAEQDWFRAEEKLKSATATA